MDLLFCAVLPPELTVVHTMAWAPMVAWVYRSYMKRAWLPPCCSLGEQGILPTAMAVTDTGHQIRISCYLSNIKKKSDRLDDIYRIRKSHPQ